MSSARQHRQHSLSESVSWIDASVADVVERSASVAESVADVPESLTGVDAGVVRGLSGVVDVDESALGVSECGPGRCISKRPSAGGRQCLALNDVKTLDAGSD